MNLEDHVGDIIRKARAMNGVSASTAALAAEVSEADLATLEKSGQVAKPMNFTTLGKILALQPQKLMDIAEGWLPTVKDLAAWRELRVFTTASEDLTVNCYLVWDEATRDAALFDTGVDARPVLACLQENQLQLRHIFTTHSHWDHVEAMPAIRTGWPQARLHNNYKNAPVAQRNKPGEVVQLGSLRISHRETPGHAADGVTYLIGNWPDDAPHVAIVGDTIFAGSMGNGNGEWDLAWQKIREQILSLPAETLLCPGHGPLTTVAEEKKFNPFF